MFTRRDVTGMDELIREMINPPPPRHDPARRRRMIGTVAVLGMAGLGITSLATSAVFTDNERSDATGITTGTVDIASSPTVAFDVPSRGLAPGESTYAAVTVTNSGSLALRYAVSYLAVDQDTQPGDATHTPDADPPVTGPVSLASQLELSVFATASCTASGVTTAEQLASVTGGLSTATDPVALIGTPTASEGSTNRLLTAAATSETLCVRVAVPQTVGNAYQGTSTDIRLVFDATQDVAASAPR